MHISVDAKMVISSPLHFEKIRQKSSLTPFNKTPVGNDHHFCGEQRVEKLINFSVQRVILDAELWVEARQ